MAKAKFERTKPHCNVVPSDPARAAVPEPATVSAMLGALTLVARRRRTHA